MSTCLNPFEIRAGQKHKDRAAIKRVNDVLIPLKSGQARNSGVFDETIERDGLNPFEIRAGQKRRLQVAVFRVPS